ncbi:S-layer homology domain-containing protein [Brevibacillus ruminantium]|uniref:S-layer homology domain-containing protein n=1 Tax=Brevibacillus ruminantium TaxID=2950604 RepID=A0ABY4WL55_9BACL|nr:S-layer homology domain-containing protein [Brevibacillus ruminantium]USG65381.1 S-layer homology domain-containing protein [Brevibacillus ruminantium]
MQKVWRIRQTLITLMAVILVLAGVLPGTVHQAYAVGGNGISLDGFSTGSSGNDPYVHYDDRITISGTFVGVDGANLRISIRNNGVTEDLTTTKPIIESDISKFVFTNVSLKPGMNEMNFYELRSSGNRSLFTFYVVYNTTPAFSNLKINEVAFSNDPDVPTVAYVKRNTALTGKATNADTIRVNNKTTGETFTSEVNRSGSFALDLNLPIGLNVLEIQGLSNNKEVSLIEREVLFTNEYTTPGSNDIFYNVKLASTKLLNPAQATIVEANFETGAFAINGEMLIHRSSDLVPFAVKAVPGNSSDTTTNSAAGTVEILDKDGNQVSTTSVSRPTDASKIRVIGQNGEFEQWAFASSFPQSSAYVNGETYTIKLTYPYVENKYVDGAWQSTEGTVSVKYHVYPFKYMKTGLPQFVSATLSSEGNQKVLEGGTYSVRSTPFTIDIATKNIAAASPFNQFTVTYGSPESLAAGDYSISRLEDASGNPTNVYRIKITKPPARQTKVTVKYADANGNETLSFNITPDVVPHLQMSYVSSSNKTIYLENQLELTDLDSPPTLKGSVKNYASLNSNNIKVELDGKPVPFDIDSNKSDFIIKKDDLANALNKNKESGIRVLEIKLTDYPNVKFKYNIKFTNKDIPKIEDIKLQVEQNRRDVDLKKKSTDTAYSTNSLYLSNFSFKVNSKTADEITVRKDGKVIAVFKYESSKWKFVDNDPEYLDALRDAQGSGASSNNKLKKLFERTNFNKSENSSSDKIEAAMDSDDYQDLLDELNGLSSEDLNKRLPLFPLMLNKGGSTTFEIAAAKGELITREKITIMQTTNAWVVLDPVKPEDAKYVTVNANSVPIKIFAENANKVTFGKIEAVASQTDTPKFEFSEKHGRPIPTNGYYVFEATVPLKAGLNTIKYTVEVGSNKYNDEIQIFNAASTVTGAEYRDTLGKKTSFSVFGKDLELKFPAGTVLLNPPDPREGNEVHDPKRDIHSNVMLYFGIADRTTGAIQPGDGNSTMRSIIAAPPNFNFASPLYYIDAGDVEAVGGRDPYFNDRVTVDGREVDMEPWWQRYKDNLVPSKQGTLTIKYNDSIVDAANTTLAIFYHDGSNKGWVNIGGVVATGKKTVTVPFKGFGYYMVMKIRNSFPDVVRHDFARDAIETLYSKGIMNSYSNSTFGTEMKITRGEFATMIVKALDLPIDAGPYSDNSNRVPSEPTFTDVDRNDPYLHWDWNYEYIETAARAGIIRGKDAKRFFPDDYLSRQEAAIIIARALNLKLGSTDAAQQALGKSFTDAHLTGYYAAPSVLAVTKAKIMNGEPNDPTAKKPTYRFNPTGELTRAEMAVITVRIMTQLKKLPK